MSATSDDETQQSPSLGAYYTPKKPKRDIQDEYAFSDDGDAFASQLHQVSNGKRKREAASASEGVTLALSSFMKDQLSPMINERVSELLAQTLETTIKRQVETSLEALGFTSASLDQRVNTQIEQVIASSAFKGKVTAMIASSITGAFSN